MAAAGSAPPPVALLRIENVSRVFGGVRAVDGVSLDVFPGEFLTLLGASGSGKTTLLRAVAGFERPDEGRIWLTGEDVTDVPPYARPLNMMFQSYALFPHMTVEENVAFGLRQEKLAKDEVSARVTEMLALVDLSALARRKPHQLSGGQSQRVALARSLAKHPKLLLLDEPLAALDKRMRDRTQFELKALQKRVGITFMVVTHDQEEAMAMSSRIALMDAGRIVQVGSPREIYDAPASRFVAGFVGSANLIDGKIASARGTVATVRIESAGVEIAAPCETPPVPGTVVTVAVRPERLALGIGTAGDNRLSGTVGELAYLGGAMVCHVRLADGTVLRARVDAGGGAAISAGDAVTISWPPQAGVLLTR